MEVRAYVNKIQRLLNRCIKEHGATSTFGILCVLQHQMDVGYDLELCWAYKKSAAKRTELNRPPLTSSQPAKLNE